MPEGSSARECSEKPSIARARAERPSGAALIALSSALNSARVSSRRVSCRRPGTKNSAPTMTRPQARRSGSWRRAWWRSCPSTARAAASSSSASAPLETYTRGLNRPAQKARGRSSSMTNAPSMARGRRARRDWRSRRPRNAAGGEGGGGQRRLKAGDRHRTARPAGEGHVHPQSPDAFGGSNLPLAPRSLENSGPHHGRIRPGFASGELDPSTTARRIGRQGDLPAIESSSGADHHEP
jgi:hypothetical protein